MKNKIFLAIVSFLVATSAMATPKSNNGYMKNDIMYLYASNENNIIECTAQELCDISLLRGDVFQRYIFTYGGVWSDSAKAKINYVDNNGIQHVVLQATDVSQGMLVILVGHSFQYHFYLSSVKKSKTNKYVFIEEKKIGNEAVIDDGLKLDFKGKQLDTMYYMSGDVDSSIMPEEVFNDGKSTYIKLSDNIEATELPVLHSFDEQGRLIQLNNPRYRKPFFVIDNLPTKIAISSGSVDNDNQIRVDIYKGQKPNFWKWLMLQYDRG